MKKTLIPFIIAVTVLILFTACTKEGAVFTDAETSPKEVSAQTIPGQLTTNAADNTAAQSASDTEACRLVSLKLCVYAGGPPAEGEDLRYIIEIRKDGPDYLGSLNRYGKLYSRALHETELLRIESLLEDEKISEWDGYDIQETSLFDGFTISFVIDYSDGTRVSGKGYGHMPRNYSDVMDRLAEILEGETADPDIVLSLQNGPALPSGTDVISLQLENHSDSFAGYGRGSLTLYRYVEEEWRAYPWRDGATVTAEWIVTEPQSFSYLSFDIGYLCGVSLMEGEYRIEMQLSVDNLPKRVSAYFSVTP